MSKKIKITILGALLILFPFNLSCGIQVAEAKPVGESYVKVYRELTVIKCTEGKKCKKGTFASVGSGFSLFVHRKYDTVMTAGHVCSQSITKEEFGDVEQYSVVFKVLNHKKEIKIAIPIIVSDKAADITNADLCMLYVKDLKIPKLKFSKRAPRIGENVVSMSSPGGIYHPPTVPMFRGIYSGSISKVTALATVSSSPGSSGGPIMIANNRVVGVIFAVSIYNSSVTLINDYAATKDFIKKVRTIIDNYESQLKRQ